MDANGQVWETFYAVFFREKATVKQGDSTVELTVGITYPGVLVDSSGT